MEFQLSSFLPEINRDYVYLMTLVKCTMFKSHVMTNKDKIRNNIRNILEDTEMIEIGFLS